MPPHHRLPVLAAALVAALLAAGFPPAAGLGPAPGLDARSREDPSCRRPTALAAGAAPRPPVRGNACPGIRPGAAIGSSRGQCTLAWILEDGYAVTAGHCVEEGGEVWLQGGPVVGTAIYSDAAPIGDDFAVVELRDAVLDRVDPRMCGWGRASGTFRGDGLEADRRPRDRRVRHFGHGLVVGDLPRGRARTGVLGYVNGDAFTFEGVAVPGDSGSPAMLADGAALGVITDATGLTLPTRGGPLPGDPALLTGSVVGTRLDHGLAMAENATGRDFRLATAS